MPQEVDFMPMQCPFHCPTCLRLADPQVMFIVCGKCVLMVYSHGGSACIKKVHSI